MPNSSRSARLQSLWYDQVVPPWPLRLLSGLFGMVVRIRASLYRTGVLRIRHVARPVIVVGNLTVGGTGKTPLVLWLVAQLRQIGLHPGVVLRGYGGSGQGGGKPCAVEPDSDPRQVGDEALLLRLRCGAPVIVGRDRVRAAQMLVQAGVDVIIADDGLQHLRLGRDFEIAVIDAARGMGNGYLLPAGPLREPPTRLGSVGAIVVNGEGAQRPSDWFTMTLRGEQLWSLEDARNIALASLRGQQVHAIAGIGNPQRFFAQLSGAGLQVLAHAFPDHHHYRAEELQFGDELPVLMTQKDAVKCRIFAAANRWYLPVEASFAPQESAALLARLKPALQSAENK